MDPLSSEIKRNTRLAIYNDEEGQVRGSQSALSLVTELLLSVDILWAQWAFQCQESGDDPGGQRDQFPGEREEVYSLL